MFDISLDAVNIITIVPFVVTIFGALAILSIDLSLIHI